MDSTGTEKKNFIKKEKEKEKGELNRGRKRETFQDRSFGSDDNILDTDLDNILPLPPPPPPKGR